MEEQNKFLESLKVNITTESEKSKKNSFVYHPEGRNVVIGGAWPYANSSLHLGHLAGLISGDVLARYHRQIGDNVIYVSGTDCHGTPITERAKKEGRQPSEIAEHYHAEFAKTFNDMNFSYDLYTKTKDEEHKKRVQDIFKKIYDNGYIYEKSDLQPYCEHCKKFVADREVIFTCPACGAISKGDQCDCGYIPETKDLEDATCQECKEKTILRENKNLYLALSKLQPQIEEYVAQNQGKWRTGSRTETAKFLEDGLNDRAVTRDLSWGVDIPIEGYEDKKMYVWIDAVLGYITTTQRFCEQNGLNWEDFWKENGNNKIYMVHGKDNITFHTIILPALLLATGENYHLPDTMVATQYLNINSEKISKSKGNGITISQMIRNYNTDSLRYFLVNYGPERKDSDFSIEDYISVNNSEVTNKFGNLVNRTLGFKGLEAVPNGKMNEDIQAKIDETYEKASEAMEALEFRRAGKIIMELIEVANRYYDEQKPWVQKKEDLNRFNDTIYTCTNVIANLSNLLNPVMPEASEKLRDYLGIETPTWEQISATGGRKLENIKPLFTRYQTPALPKKVKKNVIQIGDESMDCELI